ncbi:DUF4174 domain-containing protein [Mycolicibacterium sp. 018/SC-01/001]|uniref:DUF4174 domain-containing protein n=1 Tax=Mycolicibacterium sp. 018/SC-01/001 TaxID=2592069 RepID=UPI0011802D2E|nr:DUF4174 domain-containing protein [Mycolicibacterium sp. 018/SC-01/001]TRW89098.1 DUF4174 domain-containing protein [Mycolicibacterium sp. 018/SC-01/001]
MALRRSVVRLAFVATLVVISAALGSATASATGLGDYLWERRPLLVFAPTGNDPRLTETLRSIDANRCAVADRDIVVGVVVAGGGSSLDGQPLDAGESDRLRQRYAVDPTAFSVVLIGKDGGEKWRTDDVPDLKKVFSVIDGMPMRSREINSGAGGC